jgi:hypothetical protein
VQRNKLDEKVIGSSMCKQARIIITYRIYCTFNNIIRADKNFHVNGSGLKSLPGTLTHEAGGITGKLKGLIGNP